MIHPHGRIKGSFPRDQIIIRDGDVLTNSYVLCADNAAPQGFAAGDIIIEHAAQVTFWIDASFGSTPATSIEIKPVFIPAPYGSANLVAGTHVGDNIYVGDLESNNPWTTVTSASNPFAAWMVGKKLHIVTGTNFTPGLYTITGFNSAGSITVASAVGSGGAASNGDGGVAVEYQECAISTSSGTSTLYPHIITLTAADFTSSGTDASDGCRVCYTMPLPAAVLMRVFARCTGTATGSSLVLGVTLMPEGGL